jgi:hypothetical protein
MLSVELGVVIGKNGRDIPISEADSYIAGYGVSIRFRPQMSTRLTNQRLRWTLLLGTYRMLSRRRVSPGPLLRALIRSALSGRFSLS